MDIVLRVIVVASRSLGLVWAGSGAREVYTTYREVTQLLAAVKLQPLRQQQMQQQQKAAPAQTPAPTRAPVTK